MGRGTRAKRWISLAVGVFALGLSGCAGTLPSAPYRETASPWRAPAETQAALRETHRELLALLDQISDEALNRIGSHPIWGTPVTLASVLRVPYRHERAHRDEILALAEVCHSNICC